MFVQDYVEVIYYFLITPPECAINTYMHLNHLHAVKTPSDHFYH